MAASKNAKSSAPAPVKKDNKNPWEGHVGTHADMVVAEGNFSLVGLTQGYLPDEQPKVDAAAITISEFNANIYQPKSPIVIAKDEKGYYVTAKCMVDSGLADIMRYGKRTEVEPTEEENVYRLVK